ncbi:MAG TPA: sulfur carrier protein ThiS [Solirubrobacteraceae bacterium]|jgi:sulfur carrier protein|nr:sulfur carrier protein ThiS [Solirubrobacteraceae bacterium]
MIYLNGDPHDDIGEQTVARLLALLELEPDARGIAVAVDGEVVPRTGWSTFAIPDGARVEVLTAMQGG